MTEPTYTFTLTAAQLAVINAGLQELPMKHAAPVVMEINRQIAAAAQEPDDASSTHPRVSEA